MTTSTVRCKSRYHAHKWRRPCYGKLLHDRVGIDDTVFLTHPLLLVRDHLLHGGERRVIYAEVVRDEGDVPGDKLPGHER